MSKASGRGPGKVGEDRRAGTRCFADVLFGDDSIWLCSVQQAYM